MDTEKQRKINFVLISTCRTSHLKFHLFVRARRERLEMANAKKAGLFFIYFASEEKKILQICQVLVRSKKKFSTTSGVKKYQFFISNQNKEKYK